MICIVEHFYFASSKAFKMKRGVELYKLCDDITLPSPFIAIKKVRQHFKNPHRSYKKINKWIFRKLLLYLPFALHMLHIFVVVAILLLSNKPGSMDPAYDRHKIH